ncbi:site-specific DNA-methyltransferase [Verrucomicrobiales bacterium BCK34]|nr:site-specific DNA-methyltransferase [Verrucomicrobiales bacterium BCK34]
MLALKALEQEYAGKIKCVFIDPPYNTGQMFDHYDDGLEHSVWLTQMYSRFEILEKLLSKDGVLFCQLNDDEMAYGKVILDEIFSRKNFVNQVSVKMKQTAGASGGGEDKRLKKNIEYLLVYAKDRTGEGGFEKFNDLYDEEDLFEYIEEMRSAGKSWKYTRIVKEFGVKKQLGTVQDGGGNDIEIFVHEGSVFEPISKVMKEEGLSEKEVYFKYYDRIFRDTNAQSSIRTRVMEATEGKGDFFSISYKPISGKNKGKQTTLYYKGRNCDLFAWLKDIASKSGRRIVRLEKAGTYWDGFPLNNLTKEGGVKFPNGKKPEALIQKVLELATNPGDLVLDSFLGSGTTAAVAHKMGRRWIGIELGEHCHTHCIPRLQKVIDGDDPGGITKAANWKGGGGFRYYRLAPSLIKDDQWGNPVINPEFEPERLAEAVCKIEGFTYAPSEEHYWLHGQASETDFIYVTTQSLSRPKLEEISEAVGADRSLLVCCAAFRVKPDIFPNLTLKKIPKAVLHRCEWDHDDYSLEIENLPEAPKPAGQQELDLD